MKKILSIMAVILLGAAGVYSQSPAPGIFNYQGVARNSVGNVLVNKTISLRLTVHDGSAAGPTVYQESRTVTTNPFGLFNVQVGSAGATSVTGTIAGVNWGVGNKYIQVEIDPNGGSTFINIGTAQIASVPYSLYSSLSNDLVLPFNKTQADAGTLFRVNNSGSGNGIMGTAVSGNGLTGSSTSGNGVNGTSTSAYGVSGVTSANNAAGILGDGTGAGNSSGVMGRSGEGAYPGFATNAGVTGRANANYGVAGYAITGTGGYFTSTSGLALNTAGNLRHTGIGEALNRILRSDAAGNATWVDPAAAGIVTGSGTVNYVPKWTPVGTNLGNSQIFDDGTNVGIGTTTPGAGLVVSGTGIWKSAIGIQNTTSGMEWRMNVQSTAFQITKIPGSTFTPLQLFSTGGMDFSNSAGASIMRLLDNGNVGVNTTTPGARLDVITTGANSAGSFTINNAASTVDALFATTNTTSTTPAAIHGVNGVSGISAVAKKGVWGESDNGLGIAGFSSTNNAIFGISNSGTAGVVGGNFSGVAGLYGTHLGSGYGLYATSFTGIAGRFENNNAANTSHTAEVFNTSLSNTAYGNAALYVRRGVSGGGPEWLWTGIPTTFMAASENGNALSGTSSTFTGVTGHTNTGVGVYGWVGGASGAAIQAVTNLSTAYALQTFGKVMINGQNAATNRILTSTNASGDALWQDPAAVGIVSGSGTLNFLPKWTPSGTALGNSMFFDDASTTNLGGGAGGNRPSSLTLWQTPGTSQASLLFRSPAGELNGIHSENDGKLYFTANTSDPLTADKIMTLDDDNARGAGIGTTSPRVRLEVQGEATGIYTFPSGFAASTAILAEQLSAGVTNNTAIGAYTNGAIGQQYGVIGTAGGSGFLNAGGAFTSRSVSTGENVGIYAAAQSGASNVAGWFDVPGGATGIRITDGTQGAGKVLTSDFFGNGSWQDLITPDVHISIRGLPAGVIIPTSTVTPITQWTTIADETGGANYNNVTGSYTISVSGYYEIDANVSWLQAPGATIEKRIQIHVNGAEVARTYGDQSDAANDWPGDDQIHYERRFNAGDQIQVRLNQDSGGNITLNNFAGNSCRFSVKLIHK